MKTSELRPLGGFIYFNGGPDALFPQGRTRNVAEWIPVLAIQHGSVTYFYRKTDVHLPTGGKFLTYVYAGSRRHPAIDAEDD
jgi:hypothetical protein